MENETEECGALFMMLRTSLQTIYEMICGIVDPSETVETVEIEQTSGTAPIPKPILMSADGKSVFFFNLLHI